MQPSDLLGRYIDMQNDKQVRIMGIEHIDKDDLLRTEFEVQYQENGSDFQSVMTYNEIINGMPLQHDIVSGCNPLLRKFFELRNLFELFSFV